MSLLRAVPTAWVCWERFEALFKPFVQPEKHLQTHQPVRTGSPTMHGQEAHAGCDLDCKYITPELARSSACADRRRESSICWAKLCLHWDQAEATCDATASCAASSANQPVWITFVSSDDGNSDATTTARCTRGANLNCWCCLLRVVCIVSVYLA